MTPLRGALVGIGGIGSLHGEWMQKTGEARPCAVCDTSPAMRARAAEKFPGVPFHDSLDALLLAEKPDFVVLATPHDLHAPFARRCVEAGAHVVVEKPLALSHADAVDLVRMARRCGRALLVFHNRHVDPWILATCGVLESGLVGRPLSIQTCQSYAAARRPAVWRARKAQCGGILWDWGVHQVEYLLHLTGMLPEAVSGHLWRAPDADPSLIEGFGRIRLHFAGGVEGEVVNHGASVHPGPRLLIHAERGTITDEWNYGGGRLRVHTFLPGNEKAVTEVEYAAEGAFLVDRFYRNLLAVMRGEAQPLVPPERAAYIIGLLETAERSHACGGAPLAPPPLESV